MRILFLGPQCPDIENALLAAGHDIVRREEPFDTAFLEKYQFDFGVSYGFRHIIRPAEIAWFQNRLINLHISCLPWNRGADPNLWSWLDNTPKGVTIHLIDAGVDTGDILLQQEINFDADTETLYTSYEKLSKRIEQLFIENFPLIFAGNMTPQQQDGQGTFHTIKDKIPFLYLIERKWWETSVSGLARQGQDKDKTRTRQGQDKDKIRRAAYKDIDFVFSLANDPSVRNMSLSTAAISRQEHEQWFSQKLQTKEPFYICEHVGEPCGYIRFAPDANEQELSVSIAIHSHFRQKQLAKRLLPLACKKVLMEQSANTIKAVVKTENTASYRLFLGVYFVECSEKDTLKYFQYPGYDEFVMPKNQNKHIIKILENI